MLLIDRYLTKTVVYAIVLVICMLTGLQVFILFVNELGDIGKGNYGISQALIFVLMTMPYQVYLFLPMACLLGCLIGLGVMASANELIIMRSSCMSIGKITKVIFKVAIVLILAVTMLGELIFPRLILKASDNKFEAINSGQTLITNKGVWLRSQNDFINISKVLQDDDIEDITQFHFDENHNLIFIRNINKAKYIDRHWIAYGIKQTNISSNKIQIKSIAQMDWKIEIRPSVLSLSSTEPDEMTFPELYKFLKVNKDKYLSINGYKLAFWQRITQPFTTIVMMMLAVPFIFGPLRSSTMGSKLLLGATIGFGFYILNRFFGSLSQIYQFSTIYAAIGPTIFFAALGIYLMKKIR
jgi:lipopolysaccharide export system permease protein